MGRAKNNPAVQQALLQACRDDILFFINVFVYQQNPNPVGDGSPEIGPFITWEFQDRAICQRPTEDEPKGGILWAIEARRDLFIEKSREMGASWICLIVMLWVYLFFDWKAMLCISRSADAVDIRSNMNSLFAKLDFIIEHLPDWMTRGVSRRKMGFFNKKNRSSITGQASTGEAGVGGRAWFMFIDEFSAIKEDVEVRQRTSDTSGCRLFNGTHRGLDTEFFNLSQQPEIMKLQMHWTEHPDKVKGLYRWKQQDNTIEVLDKDFVYPEDFKFQHIPDPVGGPFPGLRSPWYDEQCIKKGSARGIAMDLDINPKGSVSQFFDALMIRTLKELYCRPPVWEGDIHCEKDTGKPLGLVPCAGGPLKLWVHPDVNGGFPFDDYCMGWDISTGTGATNSCGSIASGPTGEKVAAYITPFVDAKKLAPIAVALANLFKGPNGGALMAWELPGPGATFGTMVLELGYRNIFYRSDEMAGFPRAPSDNPGWMNNPSTSLHLLEEYRAALNQRAFLNHSEAALEECLAFKYTATGVVHGGVNNKNDPSGARINHGDETMADAICWKLCKPMARKVQEEKARAIVPGSLAWRRLLSHNAEQVKELAGW